MQPFGSPHPIGRSLRVSERSRAQALPRLPLSAADTFGTYFFWRIFPMNRRAPSAPEPYQVLLAKKLLPKNPNRCGCCATKATCGAAGGARCLAILRFGGWGFASGLLSSAGLNCANDSRTRAFAVNSPAAVGGGGLASLAAVCAGGTMVGMLVSSTIRSGHFRSERILKAGFAGAALASA